MSIRMKTNLFFQCFFFPIFAYSQLILIGITAPTKYIQYGMWSINGLLENIRLLFLEGFSMHFKIVIQRDLSSINVYILDIHIIVAQNQLFLSPM